MQAPLWTLLQQLSTIHITGWSSNIKACFLLIKLCLITQTPRIWLRSLPPHKRHLIRLSQSPWSKWVASTGDKRLGRTAEWSIKKLNQFESWCCIQVIQYEIGGTKFPYGQEYCIFFLHKKEIGIFISS